MLLPSWYSKYKTFIESEIEIFLDSYFEKNKKTSIALKNFEEVVRYWVKWWKKIRAILALESYLVLAKKSLKDIKSSDDIVKICIALEFSHSWSLMQDDLPCMDNDTLRRWNPTVWSKFWEYQAVLASDILQTLTYEILSNLEDKSLALKSINILSKAMWFYWVIWWQMEDLHFEENSNEINQEILISIHRKKTAKLIKASVKLGIIASWKEKYLKPFSAFWEKLWLAYQIKDDILDVEWDSETTWKSVWSWEEKWFVFFVWLEKSKETLKDLLWNCKKIAKKMKSSKLEFITDYVWGRIW